MIRLEDIFARCLEDIFKLSSKCLEDVLKMSWRHFSRRLGKTSWGCLKEVLKTSSKRFEDVFKMSWRRFCKKSWRRLENVLKTSLKCLEDLWPRPTFQRRINVVSTLWVNVEITLIRRWKWNKIRRRIFNVVQRWYNVAWNNGAWNNVDTT